MYFLLSNLLIVFPVAIIMYAGIVFLIIPFTTINELLGTFLNWLINFTNNILYKIEKLPFSAIDGLWINTFELFLITFLLILFIFWHSFQKKSVVWIGLLTVFVLAISFSVKSVQNFTRHELIFYSLRKNTAIAYIYQGRSVIISDIDSLDKLMNYSIKPSISSRGIDKIHFLNLGEQFTNKDCWAGSQFMQFGNFRVLRCINEFNNLALSNKIDVDVVLVQNLKILNLQNLKNQVNFKILIIESNIPDYKLKKWLAEARALDINCLALKKNPAYIVKL
jgi:competence protein ComEC